MERSTVDGKKCDVLLESGNKGVQSRSVRRPLVEAASGTFLFVKRENGFRLELNKIKPGAFGSVHSFITALTINEANEEAGDY